MAVAGTLRKHIEPGTKLMSNSFGEYEFLEELEPEIVNNKTIRYARIRFTYTGYEKIVKMSAIFSGRLSDPYYPTIAGVGYLGELDGKTYDKKVYDMWRKMMLRCYDPKDNAYANYGGLGVTVCPRWHCFANFLDDFISLPGYNNYKYQVNKAEFALDKDQLQFNLPHNQRVYSPETCIIIHRSNNSRLAGYSNRKDNGSIYFGVHRLANGNFQSRIMINQIDYFLGTYDDEYAAANMYNYMVSSCNLPVELNNVPFMTIEQCLEHKTRMHPIKLPETVRSPEIERYNALSSMEQGIHQKSNGNFTAAFVSNGNQIYIGSFDNQIAACNAYNWYTDFYGGGTNKRNNVPYMPVDEWARHRVYANGTQQLYRVIQQDEKEREDRLVSKYGTTFL